MRRIAFALCLLSALLLVTTTTNAQPVQYVKVCSLYGAGFFYVPGTDICVNAENGDAREETPGGVWRSRYPYPEGEWIARPRLNCAGQLVKLGTFSSTDFTANPFNKKQTPPVPLALTLNQFISKVYWSGGFYDPRTPGGRGGASGFGDALCLRSIDPTVMEDFGGGPINPPYGDGTLPIGCVTNSRILNMPAILAIDAAAAYPQVDTGLTSTGTAAGPYVYGKDLVVTTDLGPAGNAPLALTYHDTTDNTDKPLAGSVSVSVCVQRGVSLP